MCVDSSICITLDPVPLRLMWIEFDIGFDHWNVMANCHNSFCRSHYLRLHPRTRLRCMCRVNVNTDVGFFFGIPCTAPFVPGRLHVAKQFFNAGFVC